MSGVPTGKLCTVGCVVRGCQLDRRDLLKVAEE